MKMRGGLLDAKPDMASQTLYQQISIVLRQSSGYEQNDDHQILAPVICSRLCPAG